MPTTEVSASYQLEYAAVPASNSQVGYGLIAFQLPFDIVCDRCSTQYARKTTVDTARRRIRSAEGHTQWSYTFPLSCCPASVEIRADAIYLTYVVVSGAHALDPRDEEAIFEELRNLTGRRAAADSALAAVASSALPTACPSSLEAPAAGAHPPAFASAPTASRLATLDTAHYHFAPTASSPGTTAGFHGGATSSSIGGSPRTLLGGVPGAPRGGVHGQFSAAELAQGTSRTALQLQALYERERRDRARGGLTVKGSGGIGYNLEAREGLGIGGTDGRGGGTSRYPAPAPPREVSRAIKAQRETSFAAATSKTRRRSSTSSVAPSDSASVRTVVRSTVSAQPSRHKAAAVLARSQPAASLGAALAKRARKREDAFEQEMWAVVQKGRSLSNPVNLGNKKRG